MVRFGRFWRVAAGLVAASGVLTYLACGGQGGPNDGLGGISSGAGSAAAGGGGAAGGGEGGVASPGTASGASRGGGSGATSGAGSRSGTGGSGSGTSTGGSGSARSDAGASDAGATNPPPTPHAGNTCLKPGGGDYSKAGPYTVATTSVDLASTGELPAGDAGPTTFTIFYPQPFETSCPHPIVAWGNGTGVTGSNVYAFFNNNAASWGIVVIASDNPNTGSGQYHKAGIDYLLKQNADPTSMFYGKLSTRAGVSGHSQGGIGATQGANLLGANCEAEVCVAGGGFPPKSTAFICLTGSADLAEQGCTAAYNASQGQAFLADWDGGDHTTTETVAGYIQGQPGSIQMMRLYAAWFRCFLADDQVACKLFEGGAPTNCGMCGDPGWHVLASKNL